MQEWWINVLDIGWIILSEQPTCKTILPKFISMENNLTATIIIYYMHGSDQWHTMYKSKLVIPSTQTDVLPQHKLYLCGYAVLNWTVWYIINCAQDWNWIGNTSLMTFKTFSIIQWFSIYDWPLCYRNTCSSNSLCKLLNS
jgi:hypothetical protein